MSLPVTTNYYPDICIKSGISWGDTKSNIQSLGRLLAPSVLSQGIVTIFQVAVLVRILEEGNVSLRNLQNPSLKQMAINREGERAVDCKENTFLGAIKS